MANKELNVILSSGDITSIKLNDPFAGSELLTKTEIEALVTNDISAKSSVKYTPQANKPTHVEGTTYYDLARGTLNVMGPAGLEIALGHGVHVHVRNETGGTLKKGYAVRYSALGVNGEILVDYAIATSFNNARVFGVLQADIANNANGAVFKIGEVSGVDLSPSGLNVPVGVPLYLSDTLPGTYTSTAPDIATRIGGATNNTSSGSLFIQIENLVNLPTLGAFFQNLADATPIDSTKRTFGDPLFFPQGFSTSETLLINIADGYTFTVPSTGIYGGSFVVSMSGIKAHNNGHIIAIGIEVNGVEQFVYNAIVGRNDTVMSSSFSANVSLSANDTVSMTYKEVTGNNVDGDGNITINGIQIAIESRQIR